MQVSQHGRSSSQLVLVAALLGAAVTGGTLVALQLTEDSHPWGQAPARTPVLIVRDNTTTAQPDGAPVQSWTADFGH